MEGTLKKKFIHNKTGRDFKVKIREDLPKTFIQAEGVNILGHGAQVGKGQINDPTFGRPRQCLGRLIEKTEFDVRDDCVGLLFDF